MTPARSSASPAVAVTIAADHVRAPHFQWMDSLRGTAILLLLVWHSSAIPVLFGIPMPEGVRMVNAFFKPYRMPCLMLLSGMLLSRSLAKPLSTYYARKLATIIWPYLIWVLIARCVFIDTARMPWWDWRAWYATSYLWFLFFVGVYFLIAPLWKRLPRWSPVAASFALGILLPQGGMEQRLAYFAVFFFAGHVLSAHIGSRSTMSPSAAKLCAIVGVLLGAASMVWTEPLIYNIWTAPLSLCGIWAVIHVYRSRVELESSQPLCFVGQSSIVFYVSHFPIMMLLTRALLPVMPSGAVAVINLSVAIVVGTCLALLKSSVPMSLLFRCPDAIARAVDTRLRPVV